MAFRAVALAVTLFAPVESLSTTTTSAMCMKIMHTPRSFVKMQGAMGSPGGFVSSRGRGGSPSPPQGMPPQGGMGMPPQGGMGMPPQGGMGMPPQGGMGGPGMQGGMGMPPQGGMGMPPQGGMGGMGMPPQGGMGGPGVQGGMGGPGAGPMGGMPMGGMSMGGAGSLGGMSMGGMPRMGVRESVISRMQGGAAYGGYGDTRPQFGSPGSVRESVLGALSYNNAVAGEGALLTPVRDLVYLGSGGRMEPVRDAAARRAMRYGRFGSPNPYGQSSPYMGAGVVSTRNGYPASQYGATSSSATAPRFSNVAQETWGGAPAMGGMQPPMGMPMGGAGPMSGMQPPMGMQQPAMQQPMGNQQYGNGR